MIPFKTITKPISVDFFSICEMNGEKCIHLHGYTYESDDYWANMEACGIYMPLKEFVQNYQNDTEGEFYVDTLYQECKQYQGDYDEAGIVNVINHYYAEIVFACDGKPRGEGKPDAYLDFGEITEDTPCGRYLTTPIYEKIEL